MILFHEQLFNFLFDCPVWFVRRTLIGVSTSIGSDRSPSESDRSSSEFNRSPSESDWSLSEIRRSPTGVLTSLSLSDDSPSKFVVV